MTAVGCLPFGFRLATMRKLFLLASIILFPLSAQAQQPVFKRENCRPVMDRLTSQYDEVNMDPGEMDSNDNKVVAFMRKTLADESGQMDGFSVYTDTVFTNTLHLHWDAGEVMDEPWDMYVRGRWIVDIEWPSAKADPYRLLRLWIEKTIREQVLSTYYILNETIVPFPGGVSQYEPMLNYYAGKYRRLYRDKTLAEKKKGERDGVFTELYAVEFNPVLFIRVRCINASYVTFYVADFTPHYRSTPSYYQQTLNRFNGKPVWLEDIVSEEKIAYIKQTIRDKYAPFEADGNLDDVIRDHTYCLALTESGITLSFLPYTFSITAGSEAFQYSFLYKEVL